MLIKLLTNCVVLTQNVHERKESEKFRLNRPEK